MDHCNLFFNIFYIEHSESKLKIFLTAIEFGLMLWISLNPLFTKTKSSILPFLFILCYLSLSTNTTVQALQIDDYVKNDTQIISSSTASHGGSDNIWVATASGNKNDDAFILLQNPIRSYSDILEMEL